MTCGGARTPNERNIISQMDNKSYRKLFAKMTSNQPFSFQESVAAHLLDGKNVIIQAPTGAGKTWAATAPFIFAQLEKLTFPSKMVYSLPMRVLANSLYNTVFSNAFLKELGFNVTIQTGERPQDEYFLEGDIVFTTIDQTLSSLLSIPLSLPKRQANINAGAFIGTYLVFDEFHLLDPERSLSTLFHLLKMLKGVSPFCLMTATLSDDLLKEFAKEFNAEIVSVDGNEIKNIPSQQNKIRNVHTLPKTMDAESIIREHQQGTQTIVICNRVKKCQEIYRELAKRKEGGEERLRDTEIICIHSRFFGRHREQKEIRIKELFGENKIADAILVATQVIEVGLDITCDVMHTEISPINSLLQRAGRCARFTNEIGNVFVYPVVEAKVDDIDEQDESVEGKQPSRGNPFAPYSKELSENTLAELKKNDNTNLDYLQGQQLIDSILREKELSELSDVQAGQRREDIRAVWSKPEKSAASRLIRLIDSISIILLNDPKQIGDPYSYETISVHKGMLLSELKKMEVGDWKLRKVGDPNILDNESSEEIKYSFDPISEDDAKYETFLVANAKYVNYDSDIGLNFLGIGSECSHSIKKKSKEEKFRITKDTYEEHISYLMAAYDKYFRGKLDYAFNAFQNLLQVNVPFKDLIGFMIVLHDYGKLNIAWQKKAWKYQVTKGPLAESVRLAHTDFDPKIDKPIHFPPHAGAGAKAAQAVLSRLLFQQGYDNYTLNALVNAIGTSILRHHSAETISSEKYNVVAGGISLVKKLIEQHAPGYSDFDQSAKSLSGWRDEDSVTWQRNIIPFDDTIQSLLYFLMVRVLRICDQYSFEIKKLGER